ncbi:hypothetical protein V9T40_001374 [Parthenolecanium corni]|uniref:Sulfotransferase domain-containing protein n=1 Tax=Parthenolecanium corni TaxID=536013 RepID=A0AAN9TDD5_9HEMI
MKWLLSGFYSICMLSVTAQAQLLEQWIEEPIDNEIPLQIRNTTADILNTLDDQRDENRKELDGFTLRTDSYGSRIRNFSKLIPESGGTPMRNILVTTWRSGSTFVADVINSIPANFYHYEPLLNYEIVQIRGPPLAEEAMNIIRNLLACNYAPLDEYLEYGSEHSWLFTHNVRLWEQCQRRPQICWMPEFLTPFCKLFPFQSMKVVRMRLSLFEELLEDKRLNVKIVYLVRDPRGTLQSRTHREWCPENSDCYDPLRLCSDLISDYSAAVRFRQKFPKTFKAVRYEDLSSEPYERFEELLHFLGFNMHPNVMKFLDSHTKVNYGGVSSTYRDSKSAPFHWRQDLTFEEVDRIQRTCKPAMKLWGYAMAHNHSHLKYLNPILPASEFS